MHIKYYFYLLFLGFMLSIVRPGWGQNNPSPWPTLYPVHPDCVDSTGIAIEQNACTEAALYHFFLQHIDWSKLEKDCYNRASFYLNINKQGELDGYGILSCSDKYLVERFLEIAEWLPQNNWLPTIKDEAVRTSMIKFSLSWSDQHLDSVNMWALNVLPLTKQFLSPIVLKGEGSDFPDGPVAFQKYLSFALELPQDSVLLAKTNGQELVVRLKAVSIGSIVKIDVLNPVHPKIDSLVLDVLWKGPKWPPGSSRGSNQTRVALCTLVFHPYLSAPYQEIIDHPINPNFPEGTAALLKFLELHLTPVIKAVKADQLPQGQVPLQLFFNPDGSIYHARILKSHHPVIDAGIMEMVKKMPKWQMYRDRVRPKKSFTQIPIRIKLE